MLKFSKKVNKDLLEIVKRNSYALRERGDLELRNNDDDDFVEVNIGNLETMIEQIFEYALKQSK